MCPALIVSDASEAKSLECGGAGTHFQKLCGEHCYLPISLAILGTRSSKPPQPLMFNNLITAVGKKKFVFKIDITYWLRGTVML